MAKLARCPSCGDQIDLANDEDLTLEGALTDLFSMLQEIGPTEDAAVVVSALGDGVGFKISVVVDGDTILSRASHGCLNDAVFLALARTYARVAETKARIAESEAALARYAADDDEDDEL